MSIAFPGMEKAVEKKSAAPKRIFTAITIDHGTIEIEAEWAQFQAAGWVAFYNSGEPYSELVGAYKDLTSVREKGRES